MNLICPRCGEPYDIDSLHEEAEALYGTPYYRNEEDRRHMSQNPAYDSAAYHECFKAVMHEFQSQGCIALVHLRGTDQPCKRNQSARTEAARVAYDLLGDDIDGAAAMLEDAEMGGMFG